jgi:non-ribosomal peptide synthetase-like protein
MSTAAHQGRVSSGASTDVLDRPASELVLVDRARRQDVRWRPGERLEQLFERQCARLRATGCMDRLCVDAPGQALTYEQLDERSNRLARHLLARWIGAGHRVALLFDDPIPAYVAMLAVLKVGAAYVPLDAAFPPDRIAFIVADSGCSAVLSMSHLRGHLQDARALVIALDDMADRIARERSYPVREVQRPMGDALAYVIYTSGSTGRPKGVAVNHSSIVNFVQVAAEVYGVQPDDRMYQGLTIAFDFSFEEIWVPWAVGATLVPKPPGGSLLGADLHRFLVDRRVTAMCCVPTLLATLEEELPALRFLLVSGEACPQDLISRWFRPGRRFLNVYGPTEATVTATWTEVHPHRPVTIGVPLPTYATVVLDPDEPWRALPHGEVGEIGVAGIGLARGYVRRDDLTATAFVEDFLRIPGNASGRIYRTGDLGRVTEAGEIEYLGRIDLQVKIRGYRIELTEIESVMLQVPGIAGAVVSTYEPAAGSVELVGYYSLRSDTTAVDENAVLAHLRAHLPPYMVPAYLERLAAIPMTTSDKADRRSLPAPRARRTTVTAVEHVEPMSADQRILAELLARTLGIERLSATAHFFADLGANSLLLARFAAGVRKDTRLPAPSMKQIYLNPTIADLAAALRHPQALHAVGETAAAPAVTRAGTARYALCGTAQLLLFLMYTSAVSVAAVLALIWVQQANGILEAFQRAVGVSLGGFLGLAILPVLAKWLLVGRWTACEFPLWGARYLRLWLIRVLMRISPAAAFVGTPVYNLYLRAMGARIGAGAVILTRTVPVATDLITVGPGAVVRKDAHMTGYRAEAGRIRIGPITIGASAVVSEQTVLDIDTVIGDGAQLGHASSLHPGQAVPDGESWHGSPARRGDEDHSLVHPARCGRARRFLYGAWRVLSSTVLITPLAITLPLEIVEQLVPADAVPSVTDAIRAGDPAPFLLLFEWTAAMFAAGLLLGLLVISVVPRFLRPLVRHDVVHPLYGVRYAAHRTMSRLSNAPFYTFLFGDSSAIPHFLRALGYRFRAPWVQSGSNFGVEVKHESPELTTIGSGTMVSDGLSIMNAEYSATSFRLRRVTIGDRSFLGNNIAYPPGARIGEDCLLGTKVRVPTDGRARRGVGLLGSPAFEIPRSVQRDIAFRHLNHDEADRRRRLRAKNRHNTVTAMIFLAARLTELYVVALLAALAFDLVPRLGIWVVAAASLTALTFTIVFQVVLERAITGFRSLQPQFCSVLDPYFRRHERFWKMTRGSYLRLFDGTAMKGMLWRALGVRIGRRVFDDGCAMPEKTLVTIGDDTTLNAGSTIQAHSLEDGVFKSDRIVIGAGTTVSPYAFVHYGANLGQGTLLETDAFLMKGEQTPARSRWSGNPAVDACSGGAGCAYTAGRRAG